MDEIIVFHALSRGAPEADRRDPARPSAGAPGRPAHHAGAYDAARAHLVRVGYDPSYGARPLKRAIQREMENELARRLLRGEVRDGQHVRVDHNGAVGLRLSARPYRRQ